MQTDATGFAEDIASLLNESAAKAANDVPGIRTLMRKEKDPAEVYNYLFGLQYLEPKYTLLFQETQIEQLSPGQRGALLLIFYLLVDKGRNPIVLDQPEENLDNETVVSLLVPVLNEAKKIPSDHYGHAQSELSGRVRCRADNTCNIRQEEWCAHFLSVWLDRRWDNESCCR